MYDKVHLYHTRVIMFSRDFLWGAATAAPQIEGAYEIDERSPSIWDVAPLGKIKNNDNCHNACDHYHHYKEDIALMKKIGLKSYRFSISWSRIIPSENKINQKGIDFYRSLIQELKANNIEPLLTIYHWDLPLWVFNKGGWESEDIISLFVDYTKVLVDEFSDLVKYWIPMNEPQCFIMNGYMVGAHAPFKTNYLSLSKLTRNCLMAFHSSVETIRKYAKIKPLIGIAMAAGAFIPENESIEAINEARIKSFSKGSGLMSNAWWSDPLILGKSVRAYGIYKIAKKHLPKIKTELDFIGINNYSPFQKNWYGKDDSLSDDKKNSLGWVNDGRGLYWTIRFFSERYSLPILITENGMCDNDILTNDNRIHDDKRINYMKDYLSNLKRAIKEGYNIIGYQYWSLLDNFEWAEGYEPRFGLIYVDFKTQKRYLKDSAYYYKEVIESNGNNI